MKVLTFTGSKRAPKLEPRHIPCCSECGCAPEEEGDQPLELVVEAGWRHMCEYCAKDFWTAFFRAEDMMDGDR